MNAYVPLKLTQPEVDVLDWLWHRLGTESRAQTLRYALVEVATREGLPLERVQLVRLARLTVRPRRAASLARKIGPRRPKEIERQQAV